MSYVVLARKWRPKLFEEVVGQEHVTRTLANAISSDRVAHAYLFSGPRGIGKTTTARILAKALNCERGPTPKPCAKCDSCQEIAQGISLDVLEIDGASNRGIGEVRDLREKAKYLPSKSGFKIYIIDEVHMLTMEAFNALLKTLEEPPPHVKFIFATTAPHKVPPTVLSRCQHFEFRRLSTNCIVGRLKGIVSEEGISIDDEAISLIAKSAQGSMRDAESILDQLTSFCSEGIKAEDVTMLLGMVDQEVAFELTEAILQKDGLRGLKLIDSLISEGKDPRLLCTHLLEHFRNMVVVKAGNGAGDLIELSAPRLQRLRELSSGFSNQELMKIIGILMDAEERVRRSGWGRIPLEMAIMKLAELKGASAPKEVEGNAPARNPLLEDVEREWRKVVEMVRKEKATAGAFLLEAKPIKVDGGILTIGFAKGFKFHKEGVERPANREVIEKTLEEVLRCKLSIEASLIDLPDHEEKAILEEGSNEQSLEEGVEEPMVKKVLEIFEGKVVERKEK